VYITEKFLHCMYFISFYFLSFLKIYILIEILKLMLVDFYKHCARDVI